MPPFAGSTWRLIQEPSVPARKTRRTLQPFGLVTRTRLASNSFTSRDAAPEFCPRPTRKGNADGGVGKSCVLWSFCGSFLSRKDPHLPTFGQKRHYPLQYDEESVRESDQEIDVHDCPDNPSRKSGEAEHAKIGERVRTPRDREIAFVPSTRKAPVAAVLPRVVESALPRTFLLEL